MGIPYEVIEASGNEGFGSSSGREIPETAFYAILQEELNWLIHDFVNQIARPMVQVNASLGLLPYDTFGVLAHPLESNPMEMEYDETKQQPQTDAEGNEVEGPSPEEQEAEKESQTTGRRLILKIFRNPIDSLWKSNYAGRNSFAEG
jgi:hypothetical protein